MEMLKREDFMISVTKILDEIDESNCDAQRIYELSNDVRRYVKAYNGAKERTKEIIDDLKKINEDGNMDKAICILSNLRPTKKELKI